MPDSKHLYELAYELLEDHGFNCEFLTVVERAPHLTETEALFVHDIIQEGVDND